jgi:hypothetical protein
MIERKPHKQACVEEVVDGKRNKCSGWFDDRSVVFVRRNAEHFMEATTSSTREWLRRLLLRSIPSQYYDHSKGCCELTRRVPTPAIMRLRLRHHVAF